MTVIFRVILVIVSILTMAFMMRKIRQAKVQIEAALFWVIMALILVVFSLFPAVADACAHLLGIYSTPNFLFLFMIFLLIVKVFGMTLQMSQMESRQKELVQRIALDQKDREELELKIQRFLEKEESAGKDSREVMSLFQDTSALGIMPDDIGGCPLGAPGGPEFGTDFAMQMLLDTKPKYFSDLVRIAGLAHGTDVWLGNAQTLIQEGKATIQTAICTRDDIMVYLIAQGLEQGLSFTIMESVRKGKGLKPEWEEEMKAHGVPEWYIWSCKKIKYMFPKAHAAAYVMMAWRIAYCKIFYPLAYYAAFFSIRASAFSYEIMCQGRDKLEYYLADYKKRADTLSKKEQDTLRDMRIVQEMYARGFDFTPIDIYRAKARHFQIIDGKLMPSLSSIDGLGEKAADAVVDAVKDGAFLSIEDFSNRSKVNGTLCSLMSDLGLLKDLPKSNQLSLFDL